MKKRILNIAFLAVVLLSSISCSDVFDYEDDSRWTYDEIFQDYTEAGSFLNTCYATLPSYGQYGGANTFLAVFTDEAQTISKSSPIDYYNGEMSSSNEIINADAINSFYIGIRNCNIFLANIDNVTNWFDESYKGRWPAEVYVLRAYYAWMIVKRYGPMPIPYEILDADFDYSTLTKPTFEECVNAIIDDCDTALSYSELKWSRQFTNYSSEYRSMSREIAYAIKSQASLFAASPLWNPDGDTDLYQRALELTEECVEMLTSDDGGRLTLFADVEGQVEGSTNYQDLFMRNVYNSSSVIINKEAILHNGSRMSNLWKNYGIPISTGGVTSSAGLCPVQELVDAYDFADGTPLLDLENPYADADHLIPNYNPDLTAEQIAAYEADPYANRDPRMGATIFANGDYVNPADTSLGRVEIFEGGNCQIDLTNGQYTQSGYYLRKFILWTSGDSDTSDGMWFHYRLAEMYLNYAEAIMMANGGVATQTALDYVNLIRARAEVGLLELEDLTMARLRNERRIELAFEEHRYFDLRRWKLNQDYEGVVTGMKIVSIGSGEDASDPFDDTFSYERFVLQERDVTADKYRLRPISKDDELKYLLWGIEGGLQNPGW